MYPILQGCPGLPHVTTLFNICIDDLLEELQTVCLQDGIAMNDALDRLVAMAYADDLKRVSGVGLQRIIDLVKTTLKDRQRDKSHTMMSNPNGSASSQNEPIAQPQQPDIFMW
jgi:hypothetical protein